MSIKSQHIIDNLTKEKNIFAKQIAHIRNVAVSENGFFISKEWFDDILQKTGEHSVRLTGITVNAVLTEHVALETLEKLDKEVHALEETIKALENKSGLTYKKELSKIARTVTNLRANSSLKDKQVGGEKEKKAILPPVITIKEE